jgi:hypothetical protein
MNPTTEERASWLVSRFVTTCDYFDLRHTKLLVEMVAETIKKTEADAHLAGYRLGWSERQKWKLTQEQANAAKNPG